MDALALAGKTPTGVSAEAAARRLRRISRRPAASVKSRDLNAQFISASDSKIRRLVPDPTESAYRAKPKPLMAPAVHTSRSRGESYLIISDTQEPFGLAGGVAFAQRVAREYGVPPEGIYHVGDEADLYSYSKYLRSPQTPVTPAGELVALRERMARWYRAFPGVRVCRSNHVDRLLKRAAEAGLPSETLRVWSDLIGAPPGWEWRDHWRVNASRQPFLVEHGHHGSQALTQWRLRVLANGLPTVFGHQVQAGVLPVRTAHTESWAMCVGALIDRDAVAFEYGKPLTWQPCLGIGVVVDGGRTPIWVPYG
jgi:hypothetical protein